jgi:hypothetical protein
VWAEQWMEHTGGKETENEFFLEPTHRGAVGPLLSSFGSPSFRHFTSGLFSYGTFYPRFPPLCNATSLIGSLLR